MALTLRDIFICFFFLVLFCGHWSLAQDVKCEKDKYPPDSKTKVGTYVINLDLPPEKRWIQLGKEMGPKVRDLLAAFKEFITDWGSWAKKLLAFIDANGGSLDNTLPYPFAGEIQSLSNSTGINLGEMLLYNLFYEFFTVCTSVVAQDANGELYHARNLDFGLFLGWDVKNNTWSVTERLRPLIVNLDWQRGGKTVFKSVNFAGYTGILTAIKPKIFTMTMNERFNADGGFIGIIEWFLGQRKERWMGFLTRDVMENATSYSEAVSKLNNTVMLAPAYFIVGGNKSGEASVITRARDASVNYWTMKEASKWYILETNYDHWKAPLFLDDRRTPAHLCMNKAGQKAVGFPGLFNMLSSQPVLNKLTTYTALMKVSTGELETYIQTCGDPCAPW